MEILKTRINQIHLTKFDEIPLVRLISTENLEGLTKLFDLHQVNVGQTQEGALLVVAERGTFVSNGSTFPFEKLLLEERKIQLVGLEGSSVEGLETLDSLREYLLEVSKSTASEFLSPVVTAEESEVIARMGFDYKGLFSPEFLDLISDEVPSIASSSIAEAELKFRRLVFSVDYHAIDKSLSDYRIGISRKEFRLESRKGYPIEERVYFSKAPLSTGDHIKLLESLEDRLSG